MKIEMKLAFGPVLAAFAALAINVTPSQAVAQAKNCPAAVGAVLKTLKINPKAVLPRDIRLACIRTGNKPAMASRNVLNGFLVRAKIKPGPVKPANCLDAVLYATAIAGMPAKVATLPNLAAACKNAKGRPALASRNFSHVFVMKNKIAAAPAAPAALAKTCAGRITAISKGLKLNPKFANARDIATACKRGKGRPVLTMRNYLDRFVVMAKIGPSIIRRAPSCPGVMGAVSKTLALNPKFASPKNLVTACKNAGQKPVLATRNFLAAFAKKFKVDNGKPAPAKMAKSCVGRLSAVTKHLRMNPKFANAKDIATACKIVKGKPALASRNFAARFVKTFKITAK